MEGVLIMLKTIQRRKFNPIDEFYLRLNLGGEIFA